MNNLSVLLDGQLTFAKKSAKLTKMQSENLLSYTVIDLSKLTRATAKTFLAQAKNVAYELRGHADMELLLTLFLRLRTIATEITYRPTGSATAYILATHVDEAMTLRPSDVKLIAQFSETDLDNFTRQQQSDAATDLTIDLSGCWEDIRRDQPDEPIQAFLKKLYTFNPNKTIVHLTGEAPITLLLLTLNWFTQLATTQLFYNNNRVQ